MCCSPQWKHHFLGVYLGQPRLIILLPCHTLCNSREKCSEIHLGRVSDMVPVWAATLNTASTPHQLLSLLSWMTATVPTLCPTSLHPSVPSHHPLLSAWIPIWLFSGMAWAHEPKNKEWRGRVGSVHMKVKEKTWYLNEKWVHFTSSLYFPLIVLMESDWTWSSGLSSSLCGLGKSHRFLFPISKIWTYQILSLRFLLFKHSMSLLFCFSFIIHPLRGWGRQI